VTHCTVVGGGLSHPMATGNTGKKFCDMRADRQVTRAKNFAICEQTDMQTAINCTLATGGVKCVYNVSSEVAG